MLVAVVAVGVALLVAVVLGFVLLARALPGSRVVHRPLPDPDGSGRDEAASGDGEASRIRREAREAGVAEREAALSARESQFSERESWLAEREGQLSERQRELLERESQLTDREGRLDAQAARLERAEQELAAAQLQLGTGQEELDRRAQQLDRAQAQVAQAEADRVAALEQVAGLTSEEARAELVKAVEVGARRDAALLVREIEAQARAQGDGLARDIVTQAVQRVASEQTAESVVSVLHLPGDEMKGRIIGREGRNIRAFEAVTGVNVIIDDTPEAVLLSCFDPVRREVGRITLEALILDGRIHPQRIEDAYEKATAEVDQLCRRAAEDALLAVGLDDLHPELQKHLGRLRYRTSYGQNVLGHLVETAHIAGVMAAELRLNVPLVKRCAFLHDIGKALTHEATGSHAIIGAELARRYGESAEVAHAIEAHHNEVAPQTVEAVLTQASDSCSGGRPGARRESLEAYVQRLERIEQIAATRTGVEKVFAMQAGREVRVMVQPDQVDDAGAALLAREIAQQIEAELTYPGQIRVTVVRESRASELAR